jgi:ABC-type nitrate/sulfonate/bicarbonate transport system substrate-binding protein
VIAAKRSTLDKNPDLIKRALAALGDGSNAARQDPSVALQPIVEASGADPSLIRAELKAVRPILAPGVRLDPPSLAAWSAWATRFGILGTRPKVSDVFDLGLTGGASS